MMWSAGQSLQRTVNDVFERDVRRVRLEREFYCE
jgi:hypothetical protein